MRPLLIAALLVPNLAQATTSAQPSWAMPQGARFERAVIRQDAAVIEGVELTEGVARRLMTIRVRGGEEGGAHQLQRAMRRLNGVIDNSVVTVLVVPKTAARPGANTPTQQEQESQGLQDQLKKFFERFGSQPAPTPAPKGQAPAPGAPAPQQAPRPQGSGSGFFVTPDTDGKSLVITNAHVVASAGVGGEVVILLKNDKAMKDGKKGTVLGYNSRYDLAIIKLNDACDPSLCKPARVGDSTQVQDMDLVVAVGAPFGMPQTKTMGIVSHLERVTDPSSLVHDHIQTDAAINPGNSGGPLFNIDGEVIGVNTSIFSPTRASVGIGFAVPSKYVSALVERYRNTGAIAAARMGAGVKELPTGEIEITSSDDGTPAKKAGLQAGDIVLEIDGQPAPRSINAFVAAIANKVPGPNTPVELTIRRGAQRLKVKVQLEAVTAAPGE